MIQISCSEGFDGGLAQEFVAESFISGQKTFISAVSSKWVDWLIEIDLDFQLFT